MSFTLLVPEYNSYIYTSSYILNRGWIDRSAKRLPTYQEITGQSKKGKGKAGADSVNAEDEQQSEDEADDEGGAPDLDEDEFDEIADRFESSYNFRFEEPYVYLAQSVSSVCS